MSAINLGFGFGVALLDGGVPGRDDADPGRVDPLVVTLVPDLGQGVEQDAPWLARDLRIDRPVNALPTATLEVTLADGWLVNVGTDDIPVYRTIEEAVPDDTLIHVRTARPNPDTDVVLFSGYVDKVVRGATTGKSARLLCRHRATLLFDSVGHSVRGQLALKIADAQRLADGEDPDNMAVVINPSEPAVYNPLGRRNCAATLIPLDDPAPGTGGQPGTLHAPLASHELDPTRQSYSFARVLLDLLIRAKLAPDGALGAWPDDIQDWNLRRLILDAAEPLYAIDPDMLSEPPSEAWARALLAKPESLGLEGLNWGNALTLVCAQAGIGYVIEDFGDVVQPRSRIRFYCPGASDERFGRRVQVKLPSGHYRTDNKDWGLVRAQADVVNCAITSHYDAAVNEARIEGAPLTNEVTIPLLPGWAYSSARDPQVDVAPSDASGQDLAIQAIGSPDWLERYTASGKLFDRNVDILRLWICPDFRDFRELARPWAELNESQYRIFDFGERAGLGRGEAGQVGMFSPGEHAVRPRPIGRCLTGHTLDDQFPPIVHFSVDFGDTWQRLEADVRVSHQRLAIYLGAEDLSQVFGLAGELEIGFVEAHIQSRLRVRVTGVIESDSTALSDTLATNTSLSRRRRARAIRMPQSYRIDLRDDRFGVSGGNSLFREDVWTGTPLPAKERFDPSTAAGLTDWKEIFALLEQADRVRHAGSIELPGIVVSQSLGDLIEGYRPGDEVEAIVAEGGRREHNLTLAANANDAYAIVSQISWSYSTGDGEGKLSSRTTLTIEDPAALTGFGS